MRDSQKIENINKMFNQCKINLSSYKTIQKTPPVRYQAKATILKKFKQDLNLHLILVKKNVELLLKLSKLIPTYYRFDDRIIGELPKLMYKT